jgi:hypothetical protein
MVACDWVRAAILVSVPIVAWLGHLTMLHLLIVAALMSVANTFFDIADRSMLPTVVRREELVDANRMLTAGSTAAEASGFAVSGWLVQFISAPGAILIDAGTFVWSALTLRGIRTIETGRIDEEEPEHFLREALSGLRYVLGNPILVGLGGSLFIMSISTQIVGTVYLLYVNQALGFDPGPLGVIFATGGFFSLLASLTGGKVLRRLGVGPVLIGSLLIVGGGPMLIAAATTASLFAVVIMLFQQSMDYPWTMYEVTMVSVRQTATADAWQGRMNGSFHVLEFGGYLLGALAGAWLGSAFGLRAALVAGGCGMLLATLPLWLSPVRRLRELPAEPFAAA